MASLLAVLEDKRQALEAERTDLMKKAEEAGSFSDVRERIDEIDTELPAVVADRDRAAAERKRIVSAPVVMTDTGQPAEPLKEGLITNYRQNAGVQAAWGDQFLGSDEWKNFLEHVSPGGREISAKAQIESPKIQIAGSPLQWLRQRAGAEVITADSATSSGALTVARRLNIVDSFYQRPLTLLDLYIPGTSDSDLVEYVRIVDYSNNAASVPEATKIAAADESPPSASHKPWSEMELLKVQEAATTIAVGTPATKKALRNSGQMRSIIDEALSYDVRLELERQTVEGNGTDELEGFDTVAGTQDQSFDTSIVLTLRKAITKVRTTGRARPNGIAMNPADIDTLYGEALTSTAPGMAAILLQLANGTLHGLPIVESEAIDAGTAWVADFRRAFLFDREALTIQATTGYMDFFMRNLVAVLAEMSALFGVIRPKAFCEVDLGS